MRSATGNEQRADDHAGVRVPPPLIYVVGFLAGAGLERVAATPNLPGFAALAAALAGVVLAGVLDGGAMRRFLRARTALEPWKPSSALVTSGPYRFTRNPMYVGMAALYLGIALAFGYLWSVALLAVVLVVIDRTVIAREERYLERRFGESYREYRTRVRRWL